MDANRVSRRGGGRDVTPLIRCKWGKAFEDAIKPALPGDALAYIRKEVKAGAALAGRIGNTAVVLRIEHTELVLVAAAGAGLIPATDTVYAISRALGLKTIRFHTRRRGLIRYVKKWPFSLLSFERGEWIYQMNV